MVAGFAEQLADLGFRFFVPTFTEVVIAHAALRVNEIERGPILVVERAPDFVVVVDRDRIMDFQILDRVA